MKMISKKANLDNYAPSKNDRRQVNKVGPAELPKNFRASAVAIEVVGPFLTRDEVASLLVAYYGAVALDRVRADELCSCGKPERGLRKEYRNDLLRHVYLLLDTLSHVSQETLAKLTALAATHKPSVVRKVLIRLFAEGACAHLVGERMWSAPEFFNALVKEAHQGGGAPKDGEGAAERMMRWLNPVDPMRISQECECGCKKSMPTQIWR